MIRRWFSPSWRRPALAAGVAVCLLAAPVAALAQSQPSLAEIARREQERRKAIKEPSKVYTDKEVKQAPRPDPAQQTAAAAPTPVPDAQAAPADGDQKKSDGPVKDQAYWKNRITQAREDLRRNDMFAEALQTRVNALTNDYIGRDDPFQRAKIGEDRQKALGEMERVKGEVDRLKKQIADIEDEARKAGAPAGWLR